ncbi:hypothetical protein [Novosphingobium sp. B1]|uniref:hypothetical protein n=1 Tax=Novosphingobium sp. B1 TaxID=1938756 RepID=UPI0009D8B25B|nr:hypothetical protein [Novosphingobium sp. B1]SMC45561.1 hypothetical protein SAMN06272759_1038 [Novosphingobium sp. B1]
MSITDKFRRYFVKNEAPIFRIERRQMRPSKFVPFNCGNAFGFFWGRWQVTLRKPYDPVWAFDGTRWVPAYTLSAEVSQ